MELDRSRLQRSLNELQIFHLATTLVTNLSLLVDQEWVVPPSGFVR